MSKYFEWVIKQYIRIDLEHKLPYIICYPYIKLLYGGEIITVRSQKLTTVIIKPIFCNSYEDVCVN